MPKAMLPPNWRRLIYARVIKKNALWERGGGPGVSPKGAGTDTEGIKTALRGDTHAVLWKKGTGMA